MTKKNTLKLRNFSMVEWLKTRFRLKIRSNGFSTNAETL